MSTRVRRLIALVLLAMAGGLTWGLSTPQGPLPPMGPFMSPFTGFWQQMAAADRAEHTLTHEALAAPVEVFYDARQVPHLYASSDRDLYFALGYVTARDRLWQMDFQTRAAAGTLAEVLGERAVAYDRGQRRMGMRYGAERHLERIQEDPKSAALLQAYADGVNAHIDGLTPRTYPLEFKVLNYAPQPFEPLHSTLMLMNLAQTLTSGTSALAQTNARALMDPRTYGLLYPDPQLPAVEPMVPPDHVWAFEPETRAAPADTFVPQVVAALDLPPAMLDTQPGAGSNAWAVHGSKTASGHPLLASDPHLRTTFPSIWYEVYLNNGRDLSVYGGHIPSLPGVAIGFNEAMAWAITAGESRALDVYEIAFRDERRLDYLHDGVYKPVTLRPETIHVRDGPPVVDTVRYTHHGPIAQPAAGTRLVSRQYPRGHALQWAALRPSDFIRGLRQVNAATDAEAFAEGLRDTEAVNLNFLYADRAGTIAAWHTGALPVRFPGQGRYISDGRDPAYDWEAFIPFAHLPHVRNPAQGFLVNANQRPADRSTYPYALGGTYASFARANRIHEVLRAGEELTVADMRDLQMDVYSPTTAYMLRPALAYLNRDGFSASAHALADRLEAWDFTYTVDSEAALFANRWRDALRRQLWQPAFAPLEAAEVLTEGPSLSVTAHYLHEGQHEAFPVDVAAAVNTSFRESAAAFVERYGTDPAGWRYGANRAAGIPHLAGLTGFGRADLEVSGETYTVNVRRNAFGVSRRMIVEVGDSLRAFVHYPGGASGNPGSPHYDQATADWAAGVLHPVEIFGSAAEARAAATATLTLSPR